MIAVWYPTWLWGGPASPVDICSILLVTVLLLLGIGHILTRQSSARPWPPESSHFPDTGSFEQQPKSRG